MQQRPLGIRRAVAPERPPGAGRDTRAGDDDRSGSYSGVGYPMMTCVDGASSIWLLGSVPRILDEGSLVRTGACPPSPALSRLSSGLGLLGGTGFEPMHRAADRPHEAHQFAGHRGDRHLGLLTLGEQLPVPLREPQLRLPGDVLDLLWQTRGLVAGPCTTRPWGGAGSSRRPRTAGCGRSGCPPW